MIRKFYINMCQKGNILHQIQNRNDLVIFHKTSNSKVQILEFEEETLKEIFKENYNCCILYNLGLNMHDANGNTNILKEILNVTQKEGYKAIYITNLNSNKETEKAYYVNNINTYIPKSQCIMEGNILYIKDWIFYKNLF